MDCGNHFNGEEIKFDLGESKGDYSKADGFGTGRLTEEGDLEADEDEAFEDESADEFADSLVDDED